MFVHEKYNVCGRDLIQIVVKCLCKNRRFIQCGGGSKGMIGVRIGMIQESTDLIHVLVKESQYKNLRDTR